MESNSVSPMPEEAALPPPEDTLPPEDDLPEPISTPPRSASILKVPDNDSIKKRSDWDEASCGCEKCCDYGVLFAPSILLLLAAVAITAFWIMNYQGGVAWNDNPAKQFNLHPVLMITFIACMGIALLMYRVCSCCNQCCSKLLHTLFHALAVAAVALGFLAVFESHDASHFYSLHSWMGLITVGLFGFQVIYGFFAFLVCMLCGTATLNCRTSMVPFHSALGLVTFLLAIATALTGLTNRALTVIGNKRLTEELIFVNTVGVVLIAAAPLIGYSLLRKKRNHEIIRASIDL